MLDYKSEVSQLLAACSPLSESEIKELLEIPPQEQMGDYAFPCFRLAKQMKQNPVEIAQGIKEKIDTLDKEWLAETRLAGPYVNFYIKQGFFAKDVLGDVLKHGENFGRSQEGQGKNVIVEYSSPNIAKPFHVGHAFTTILGQAIANIYDALGYHVIRMNHLGDYGTQFGKLIVAWRLWGDEDALEKEPIKELTRVYVKFHSQIETQPELEDEAREAFKKLENKCPEEVHLWQKFRDMSLVEFNRIYERMHIAFDNYNGESFYSDQIPEVVECLKEKGLLVESQGAQVVDLEEFGLNPCIILKSDGTSIYASRDLAAILYRARTYDYYRNIYVVGLPQSNHFQQIFAVLKKAGFDKADQNVHVGFGTVKFKEGEFSTRKGNIILLEDLLNESVAKTKKIIIENNPGMDRSEIEATAEAVGLAAVNYTFLRNSRERDIFFDWSEILDFEGDTAAYLMYTYARAQSILQKADRTDLDFNSADFTCLTEAEAFSLLKDIYAYPSTIVQAAEEYEPSVLMRRISTLARNFNRFYHNTPILKTDDVVLRRARLGLVQAVAQVLYNGLSIAGIRPVDRM